MFLGSSPQSPWRAATCGDAPADNFNFLAGPGGTHARAARRASCPPIAAPSGTPFAVQHAVVEAPEDHVGTGSGWFARTAQRHSMGGLFNKLTC